MKGKAAKAAKAMKAMKAMKHGVSAMIVSKPSKAMKHEVHFNCWCEYAHGCTSV